MRALDLDRHGPLTRTLLATARAEELPRTLVFASPRADAAARLRAVDLDDLGGGRRVRDRVAARGCLAALWLLHDFMDEAHAICQELEPEGALWHAILHRREPDAGNSKYWWSRAGAHPAFAELAADTGEILEAAPLPSMTPALAKARLCRDGLWQARAFVDLTTGRLDAATVEVALRLQRREWELCFDHEWRRGFGA